MDEAERRVTIGALSALMCISACTASEPGHTDGSVSDVDASAGHDAGGTTDADMRDRSELPYATALVSFRPGSGAGFGQVDLPDVVLGPPGSDANGASLSVVSLGVGGEIVLSFEPRILLDAPGPDLIVFENAFYVGGDPTTPFAELGEVSVSDDGETWHAWACDKSGAGEGRWPDCAGWTPTLSYDPFAVLPLDPELTGGNHFDLEAHGLSEAAFVRIRDLATEGSTPTAGFDLDAIGLIHWRREGR